MSQGMCKSNSSGQHCRTEGKFRLGTNVRNYSRTKAHSKSTLLDNQHLILGPIVITSGTAGPPGNDQIQFFFVMRNWKKFFAYHLTFSR